MTTTDDSHWPIQRVVFLSPAELAAWWKDEPTFCPTCHGEGTVECECDSCGDVHEHDCDDCDGDGNTGEPRLHVEEAGRQLLLFGGEQPMFWVIRDDGTATLVAEAVVNFARRAPRAKGAIQ